MRYETEGSGRWAVGRKWISFCVLLTTCCLFYTGVAIAWVDGTPYFFERFQDWTAPSESLRAPAIGLAPRFQIGQQRLFYAIDFRKETQYTVEATLRSIGDFCYIFVENDQWQRRVTAADVETIRRAFDDATPVDSNRGIYEIETTVLGLPPDIDGDVRILILLLDVRDQFLSEGGFIAGYFSPVNQQFGTVRDPNYGVPFRSNETEMIYLDVDPLDTAGTQGLSVLAHEFQHLIHWRYDTNEEIWVNEGCADYAVFLCGYDVSAHLDAYENSPEASLTAWNTGRLDQLAHYGAAYLWMLYLHERYGGEQTIAAIVREPRNGIASISSALGSRGYTSDFKAIFSDWRVANYLDDPAFEDGRYGYIHEDLELPVKQIHKTYPVHRTARQIAAWGSDAVLFTNGTGGGNLIVDLLEPLARLPLGVRVVEFSDEEPIRVGSTGLSATGHAYLSVDQFGLQVDKVLLLPGFEPIEPADNAMTVTYEYEARLGDRVGFSVEVLQNPVHPRYWEVLARASHQIGSEQPEITLVESGAVRLTDQPMTVIRDGVLFSHSIYVPPGRSPERIRWRVDYLGAIIGEGVLGSESR